MGFLLHGCNLFVQTRDYFIQNFDHIKSLWEHEKEKTENAKQKVVSVCKALKTARAEAIKEFAERLKEHVCFYDLDNYHSFSAVDIDVLDDIVKEMERRKYENRKSRKITK